MARCFPFPPPGYSGKCSSNEALILSIKLQEEKEKSNLDKEKDIIKSSSDRKKDRKKDKKDKKERKKEKKEKKEKKKEERRANEKQKLVVDKLYQANEPAVVPKDKCSLVGNEVEQLERSNVTEEHGRPYLQNGSSSTDSTGNSCKRKRPPVPPNGIQSNGNIIRICLSSSHKRDEPSTSGSKEQEINVPLPKRADHHAASVSKVQPCSNIIRTEPLRTDLSIVKRDATVKAPPGPSHVPSTSIAGTQSVVISRQDTKTAAACLPSVPKEKHISSHEKKLRKKQSKYDKLFDSWVPMSLDIGLVVDDKGDDSDDWLFGTAKRVKTSETQTSAVGNHSNNLPSCASFALQPRAQLLPDVDIYALPFTVPF